MGAQASQNTPFVRIGIDVGGTNTDAVILSDNRVVARCKRPTTLDIGSGIIAALADLLVNGHVGRDRIDAVMIGTTQFTNAFVEGRGLNPVGVIRIGAPATTDLPPMVDWPARLRSAFVSEAHIVRGGHGFDGTVAVPLDEAAILAAARSFAEKGIGAIAITAVFAPVNDTHERAAKALVMQAAPGVAITLSSDIGRIGLLERENAAIMNAALRTMGETVLDAFSEALLAIGLTCPLFICQNDGTLMTPARAREFPILTFASGPTNSIRGAGLLSGCADCIVIDIGGTTSDLGVLRAGLPRESSVAVDIGGVRTNFRMPDVLALGIGGGSRVTVDEAGGVAVGPTSVGHELTSHARVFGGEVLTATDIAVAAGLAEIGDPSAVSDIEPANLDKALACVRDSLTDGYERMRGAASAAPVVLVGGGRALAQNALPPGVDVRMPPDGDVANAVGAAIGEVSGEVDTIYDYAVLGREAALAEARAAAVGAAVIAGAFDAAVRIIDVEETPLPYIPGQATRVRVKAVGALAFGDRR